MEVYEPVPPSAIPTLSPEEREAKQEALIREAVAEVNRLISGAERTLLLSLGRPVTIFFDKPVLGWDLFHKLVMDRFIAAGWHARLDIHASVAHLYMLTRG